MTRNLEGSAAEAAAARVGYSDLTATDPNGGTVSNQATEEQERLETLKWVTGGREDI